MQRDNDDSFENRNSKSSAHINSPDQSLSKSMSINNDKKTKKE
jgi:hypothetical protein